MDGTAAGRDARVLHARGRRRRERDVRRALLTVAPPATPLAAADRHVADQLLDLAAGTDLYAARLPDRRSLRGWDALDALPITTPEDLVAEGARAGSPYSGRRDAARDPLLTVQVEGGAGARLYVGLDRLDLEAYSAALERSLRVLGVRRGDTLALYEFGSSPLVYLASSLFVPCPGAGAADLLGCTVICNDGLPNLAGRMVEILTYVRPRVLVIRDDCVEPFLSVCASAGVEVAARIEILVVTVPDGAIRRGRQAQLAERLGLPVHRTVRSDLALFLGVECPGCSHVHVPADLYRVETVERASASAVPPDRPGRLVVTALRAHGFLSLRMLTGLEGALVAPGCPRGPTDARVRLS